MATRTLRLCAAVAVCFFKKDRHRSFPTPLLQMDKFFGFLSTKAPCNTVLIMLRIRTKIVFFTPDTIITPIK